MVDSPAPKKEEKSELPEGVTFTKPTSQLDLEARQAKDYKPSNIIAGTNPEVDDSGYVGVDVMYQNAANETDEPQAATEGPEAVAEEAYVKSVQAVGKQAPKSDKS